MSDGVKTKMISNHFGSQPFKKKERKKKTQQKTSIACRSKSHGNHPDVSFQQHLLIFLLSLRDIAISVATCISTVEWLSFKKPASSVNCYKTRICGELLLKLKGLTLKRIFFFIYLLESRRAKLSHTANCPASITASSAWAGAVLRTATQREKSMQTMRLHTGFPLFPDKGQLSVKKQKQIQPCLTHKTLLPS